MKRKTSFGLVVLIFISLLPLIPWYLGPAGSLSFTYANITHSLGQIASLVGMTLFAITFVLSTRLNILERFLGGLDKVYKVHAIFGSLAFILLLMHPLFLVLKFIPSRLDLAARYLTFGYGLSVDFGIIALAGMIILLVTTLYVNIKYHYWKISHKFMGVFFMIAVLHIFLVRGNASRDIIFEGYYVYAVIVAVIGIVAFLYSLLFKSISASVYRVHHIKKQQNAYDIRMVPVKKPLRYRSGQFAFFRFQNRALGREFHPFSLASSSGSEELRIVVKSLGDYTAKFHLLAVGDIVTVEGPYGEFLVSDDESDMLWLAAGIGITPFLAMAKEASQSDRNTTLFYCVSEKSEHIDYGELKALERASHGNFKVISWPSNTKGRLTFDTLPPLKKSSQVFICGPFGFKDYFITQCIKNGISAENIYSEDFMFK